jgi:tripartite ATP-independent transporter DctP family solute receptor
VTRLARRPRIALLALTLAALVAALGAWRAADAAPPPDPIRMAFGSIVPEETPWGQELREIKTRVEAAGTGRIKVALFLGGRRGSENEMMSEVRRGKLQGAALSTGAVALEVPDLMCLEFPFLFRDADEVDAVLDGPIGKTLQARCEEKGLVLAVFGENGWRSIATRRKAIHTPADVKDLKVRSQESEINKSFWTSLGAAPTPIPLNEVLSALQTGVIDGFDQTPIYMSAAGWHTQIQHLTLTEHSYQGGCVVYNKRFIDALPDDLRALVLKDGDVQGRRNRRNVREESKKAIAEFERQKIEVVRPTDAERDAFRERTRGVYDTFRDTEAGKLVARIQAQLAARRGGR